MRVDGRGQRVIANYAQTPAWSPGGRKIAFALADFQGNDQMVYASNPDGTDPTLVAKGRGGGLDAKSPAWSPDGERLAFAVWGPPGTKPHGFGFVRRFGGRTSYLRGDITAQKLDWSPTRDEIAFNTAGYPDEGTIGLLDLRTHRIRFLRRGWGPSWSPDGAKIAYSIDGAIFVMNRRGTGVRELGR